MKDRTSDLIEQLRQQGHRITPQRQLVLEVLQQSKHHTSADAIAQQIVARYPTLRIDHATIYRTLRWLRDAGIVSETSLGQNHMVYALISYHQDHHHLVCEQCGEVIEVDADLLAPVAQVLEDRYGFWPRLAHISIFGICASCRNRHVSSAPSA